MHLTLRPGTNREHLLNNLISLQSSVSNLASNSSLDHGQRLIHYLEWANDAAEVLAHQISPPDIERLILTPRHSQILANVDVFGAAHMARLTNSFLNLEIRERADQVHDAVNSLRYLISRRVNASQHVVFDTSMYIKHPDKLELIDFRALTSIFEGTVNLMVPMVVIDELDKLKESRDQRHRWRAGYSLAVIDRLFPHGRKPFAILQEADLSEVRDGGLPRPEVTLELLFDPPGHARLPIPDDEIVDRALAIQPLAASPVKLFTYDTGQSTRGRNEGLTVEKLSLPLDDELATNAKS